MQRKIPYFVKLDFKFQTRNELIKLEEKIEKNYLLELGKKCFLEKYDVASYFYFEFITGSNQKPKSFKYCNEIDRRFGSV